MIWNRTKNKYGAHKIVLDGETFDSQAEAQRWVTLKLLKRHGDIVGDIERQVHYTLIPAQYDRVTGKLLERRCEYIADFRYTDKAGYEHVEDVKGMRTKEYIIKRKLMLHKHGIMIEEVKA